VSHFLVIRVVVLRLLARRIALDSCDFMVWLALSGVPRVVRLAFVKVAIAIALLVVVALGEVIIFLILLVSPPCHHVTQLQDSSRAIAPEVVVRALREEAMLEATNYVLIGDVGHGGARLKETPCVRPQGLVHLLLHLGLVVVSARPDHGSLEVVDEGLLEVLPWVDGVWLEAFKPREGCELQSHREVESFCRVGSP
jgi:hypothetical protein